MYQNPHINVYVGNPGQYQISLTINARYNFNNPPVNQMPQQQSALDYNGHWHPQANSTQVGHYNNASPIARVDSSSSALPDSSYSSESSTPGVVSQSWSYNSPQHTFGSPYGRQVNNAGLCKDEENSFVRARGWSTGKTGQYNPSGDKPVGCFPASKCSIF